MNKLRSNFVFKKDSPFRTIHGAWPARCRTNAFPVPGNMKPPDIVVFSQKPESLGSWKDLFRTVLCHETYVTYSLSGNDFVKGFWKSNAVMLVLDRIKELGHQQKEQVDSYVNHGGKVFSHCSMYPIGKEVSSFSEKHCNDITKEEKQDCVFKSDDTVIDFQCTVEADVMCLLGEGIIETLCTRKSDNHPMLKLKKIGKGFVAASAINFSQILNSEVRQNENNENEKSSLLLLKSIFQTLGLKVLDSSETLFVKQTHGQVYGEKEAVSKFLQTLRTNIEQRPARGKVKLNIQLLDNTEAGSESSSDINLFNIIVPNQKEKVYSSIKGFDYLTFKKNLKSKHIGRVLIYTNIVTSTQSVAESIQSLLSGPHGLVVTANQQMQGRGRGGNIWLSPVGCMMFSVLVQIPLSSQLGQRLPFLQHIAAVAFVRSVRMKVGYQDINVRIKWPNDIYVGDGVKIGGLIVNSSYMDGNFSAVIGIGVNVKNEKPTICLNSVIEEENRQKNSNLQHFTIEELVALTTSNIEEIIAEFEEYGTEEFCESYYEYWLHSNQSVKLEQDEEEVVIRGLDTNGFLLVERKNGEKVSLQPDGNSFDMMKGLIKIKERQ